MSSYPRIAGAALLAALAVAAPQQAHAAPSPLAGHKIALIVIEPPANAHGGVIYEQNPDDIAAITAGQADMGGMQRWQRLGIAMAMARRFKETGADVKVLFVGPAVLWLAMDDPPDDPQHPNPGMKGPHDLLTKTQAAGVTIGADEDTSTKYGVHDKISKHSHAFINGAGGPEGLVKLMSQDYQILIF